MLRRNPRFQTWGVFDSSDIGGQPKFGFWDSTAATDSAAELNQKAGYERYSAKPYEVRRNSDEQLRRLERQAALGDPEAVARLRSMARRSGSGFSGSQIATLELARQMIGRSRDVWWAVDNGPGQPRTPIAALTPFRLAVREALLQERIPQRSSVQFFGDDFSWPAQTGRPGQLVVVTVGPHAGRVDVIAAKGASSGIYGLGRRPERRRGDPSPTIGRRINELAKIERQVETAGAPFVGVYGSQMLGLPDGVFSLEDLPIFLGAPSDVRRPRYRGARRNPDERLRDLERRAAAGDEEARWQLQAMRARVGDQGARLVNELGRLGLRAEVMGEIEGLILGDSWVWVPWYGPAPETTAWSLAIFPPWTGDNGPEWAGDWLRREWNGEWSRSGIWLGRPDSPGDLLSDPFPRIAEAEEMAAWLERYLTSLNSNRPAAEAQWKDMPRPGQVARNSDVRQRRAEREGDWYRSWLERVRTGHVSTTVEGLPDLTGKGLARPGRWAETEYGGRIDRVLFMFGEQFGWDSQCEDRHRAGEWFGLLRQRNYFPDSFEGRRVQRVYDLAAQGDYEEAAKWLVTPEERDVIAQQARDIPGWIVQRIPYTSREGALIRAFPYGNSRDLLNDWEMFSDQCRGW